MKSCFLNNSFLNILSLFAQFSFIKIGITVVMNTLFLLTELLKPTNTHVEDLIQIPWNHFCHLKFESQAIKFHKKWN